MAWNKCFANGVESGNQRWNAVPFQQSSILFSSRWQRVQAFIFIYSFLSFFSFIRNLMSIWLLRRWISSWVCCCCCTSSRCWRTRCPSSDSSRQWIWWLWLWTWGIRCFQSSCYSSSLRWIRWICCPWYVSVYWHHNISMICESFETERIDIILGNICQTVQYDIYYMIRNPHIFLALLELPINCHHYIYFFAFFICFALM